MSRIKITAIRCSACGADLQPEENKNLMFCPYCGTRLAVEDDDIEVTNRIVDEARLKEAEIRLKELEYAHERELREEELHEKQKKTHMIYAGVYLLVCFFSFIAFREEFGGVVIIGAIVLGILLTSDKRSGKKEFNASGSEKSRPVAFLLCFFLGAFGAHYFYVGKIGMGILYLFTFGLLGFGWLVDVIRIAVGTFRDKNGCLLN